MPPASALPKDRCRVVHLGVVKIREGRYAIGFCETGPNAGKTAASAYDGSYPAAMAAAMKSYAKRFPKVKEWNWNLGEVGILQIGKMVNMLPEFSPHAKKRWNYYGAQHPACRAAYEAARKHLNT